MRRVNLFALLLTWAVCGAALAQAPPAQGPPFYRAIRSEYFTLPRVALFQMPPMQEALHLNDRQKERQEKILEQLRKEMGVARALHDRAAAEAAQAQAESALLDTLEPQQRTRFDQIRLQLQGPAAFAADNLLGQLQIVGEQAAAVRSIAGQAQTETGQLGIPLPFKQGDLSISVAAIRGFVTSADFLAAKDRVWQVVFEQRARALRQIEGILDQKQRAAYETLRGEPLDVLKFFQDLTPPDRRADGDLVVIGRELRLGAQRGDPDFNTKVAQPAYVSTHPAVLFDEAHHNFHTTGGRYKVFADLITSDGYRVTPNHEELTAPLLAKYDILVIANALGADLVGPEAANPAFSQAECQAIDDWVRGGGSLLLVTDHQPFGSAAEQLGKRFGIDMGKRGTVDPANALGPALVFARENHLLGDHAIINGRDDSERVNRVLTFYGQSLKGPAGSTPLLKFSDTAVDEGEGKTISAAGRAQGLALRHGKGRVVVMGEASELSAQIVGFPPQPMGMNAPGCDNRQLVLNILHWLSGLTE